MELYQDDEDEETYDQIPLQAQLDPSTPAVPNSLDLEELIDNENAWENGLESMIDVGDGKHIHKAKVLHEFTRFARTSNSTDHLRCVANIDRKSTRLNSSHTVISYAVFCL